MSGSAKDAEALLAATPYLIGDGSAARDRFAVVRDRSNRTRARAEAAGRSIAVQAAGVLPQFEIALRSDLVAESNRMEGIDSSPVELRDLVRVRRDLMDMEVAGFVEHIRSDPRLLESLGLYRAYGVADEWAKAEMRPREFELRGLHSLVMPSLATAGKYKTAPNEIGGSEHVPTSPWDSAEAMRELSEWFESGTGDAALDATVVHAWLTHIHPFDDGNGRMARLLANLALVQAHYPPLLLRSTSDREPYLDALAASDDGDILPLYDLFVSSLRRAVRVMERPDYVESKIRDELLATTAQRYDVWKGLARTLFTCFDQKTRSRDWNVRLMGYPSIEDFDSLESRNPDGNTWFAKFRHQGIDEWLLWFGYRTDEMLDLVGGNTRWPSIFFSSRTTDPRAVHPFKPEMEADGGRPAEVCLSPGANAPVILRQEYRTASVRVDEAADVIVRALCR
jgi:Fic family protein